MDHVIRVQEQFDGLPTGSRNWFAKVASEAPSPLR